MTREEAINTVRKMFRNIYQTDKEKEALETLVPELADSEDERMLREIKRYIKEQGDKPNGLPNGTVAISDMIAWFEKQKEPDYLNKFTKLPHLNSDYEVVDDWAYTPSLGHCDGNWAVCWIHCEDGDVLHECIGDTPEEAIDKAVEWFTSLGKQIPVKKVGAIISSRDKEETACGYLERCLTPDMRRVWYEACDELKKACFQEAEKQKERKPIKMEVYEVGKGTTVCGQDYKCKKDYKVGNCWYIKDAIYHCGRDGYLTDQNGISWSCTPKWFNEYIQSNTEWAEEEKTRFVSGQFLQCKLSFDGFKKGEHYWLEYVGDDMYVGRSDNILNQKFHITPRQLYTLFSQQLDEAQEPPKKEEQVSSEYETPMFEETPSDEQIIDALIHHLNEQDGFLTAINCVSTKAILSWLKKQKEQKPADLSETIVYKEPYIAPVSTPIVVDKQKPEWSESDKQNINLIISYLDSYIEEHNNTFGADECKSLKYWLKSLPERFNLQPKQEWSKEDEEKLKAICTYLRDYPRLAKLGDKLRFNEYCDFLKSLRPHWKPSEEQMKAMSYFVRKHQATANRATTKWPEFEAFKSLYTISRN